jgi:hypothetical protein
MQGEAERALRCDPQALSSAATSSPWVESSYSGTLE